MCFNKIKINRQKSFLIGGLKALFKILDGRNEFYQWDSNRHIVVEDPGITHIHFCNRTDECSLVCAVYDYEGLRVADVPNVLLQTDWDIRVYAYCEDYTVISETFKVIRRTRPADYIYEETEILRYAALDERITALESGGVDLDNYYTKAETDELLADVDVDLSGLATEAYVETAISNIKHPDPDLSDYYTKAEVDTAIESIEHPTTDLTGYATETYVDNAIAAIDIPEPEASVEEVYVGAGTPIDENVKVWIDPDAEAAFATTAYVDEAIASIGGGGSGGSTDLSNYYTKSEVDTAISSALGAIPNAEEGEY